MKYEYGEYNYGELVKSGKPDRRVFTEENIWDMVIALCSLVIAFMAGILVSLFWVK